MPSPARSPLLPRAPRCALAPGLCALLALAAARPAGAQSFPPGSDSQPPPSVVDVPRPAPSPTPVFVGGETVAEKAKAARPPLTPLTPLRMGIGIPLVALGGLTLILGVTHLALPVFVSPADRPDVVMSGCMQHGVYVPCAADRYPVGGLLLGLGGVAVLAGTAVLARWPL